jgi:hypothetical protein
MRNTNRIQTAGIGQWTGKLQRKLSYKEASWGYYPQEPLRVRRIAMLSRDNIRIP